MPVANGYLCTMTGLKKTTGSSKKWKVHHCSFDLVRLIKPNNNSPYADVVKHAVRVEFPLKKKKDSKADQRASEESLFFRENKASFPRKKNAHLFVTTTNYLAVSTLTVVSGAASLANESAIAIESARCFSAAALSVPPPQAANATAITATKQQFYSVFHMKGLKFALIHGFWKVTHILKSFHNRQSTYLADCTLPPAYFS